MAILSWLATFFGILIGVGNFPQAFRIFKRRSSGDISVFSILIFFFGAIIWTLYGIELNNFPVVITNGLAVISLFFVLLGWFLYKEN